MTIGQTIRAYRKNQGLTQNELGKLCGMTGGAISGYENGVTLPKRRTVERIAQALGISAERLIGGAALPDPAAKKPGCASDALLYDGVLAALKELYGMVEGRIVQGENGASRKYYLIKQIPDSFVLYESDITAIAQAARASMGPIMEHMRTRREEALPALRYG